MIIIALYNLKGGVGKTASCVNLAYMAAADGYRTLLWDIDPQGSASFYLQGRSKPKGGLRQLLDPEVDISDAIQHTVYECLDIISADTSAKSMDILIEDLGRSKRRIKSLLGQINDEYDFVFLDCPPGLSALSENVFHASDAVLMPLIPTTLSIRTYSMVKDYFKDKDQDGEKLMCFFTMVDLRKNMHQETMNELFKKKRFLGNYIPNLSDVEKMGIYKAPIAEFAQNSYGAKCFSDLWDEIKEKIL